MNYYRVQLSFLVLGVEVPRQGGGCGALINRWRPNCFLVLAGYFLVSEELLSFLVFGAEYFLVGLVGQASRVVISLRRRQ